MSDFGSPPTANYTAPDGLTTLNNLMSLKSKSLSQQQQQLEMQGQQSQNQSLAAKASIDTRSASEQAKLAQIPWESFQKDDGSYDVDTARKVALKVAPTTGADFADRLNTTTKNAAETKQAFQNLNTNQIQGTRSALGTWGTDPNAPLSDLLTQAEAAKANAPEATKAHLGSVVDHIVQTITGPDLLTGKPKTIEQQKAAAVAFSRAGLSNAEVSGPNGLATPQNVNVDSGGQIQPSVQAPAISGGGISPAGPPIAKTIAPQVVTFPNNTLDVVGGAAGGPNQGPPKPGPAASAPTGVPRTAQDDAPPRNANKTVQDAYAAATKNANDHVDSVRTADESYGNNKAISNAVRTLSAGAKTGPGTETWNHVMGVLGTKGADNYQELGAFLDRQAATVRGQMGLPGTNAGAEDAKMIAGNTNYNAKVIQDKNNYTEAMTDGLHMYRNGLDRVSGFGGQASPTQVAKFKSAWTNAFDPNVLIGENAYKRSKADGDAFVQTLDPKEAASLKAKRQAMHDLSNGQIQQ